MAAQSIPIADGLLSVVRDGSEYLGIDTGIHSNSPSLRKLAGQKRQSGWVVTGNSVSEWKPIGFVEHEGRIHVYGPLMKGRFLETALADESVNRLLILEQLARALDTLKSEDMPLSPVHTRALIVLDEGGVLVLPSDIMQAIREHQDYSARVNRMERFNHPDWDVEQNIPFALAAAAYFVITGHYPYDSDDEEDLHARVRAANHIPAKYRDVEIRDDVSDALDTGLTSQEEDPDIAKWADRLRSWREQGVRRKLSDEERTRREETARQATDRLERRFKRRESTRKHGRTALIIAAIVIVVGMIPGTIIRNALQPRATAGLPADEVVRVFYTSINSLDHMTMEDAVVDKAGAGLVREVTNLFVLDRQRMSVEMQSGFVDAQEWRDEGLPALPDGKSPYGVANLSLEGLSAPEGEQAFEVHYERWLPDYEQAETTGRAGISGMRVVDRVLLRQDRDDWVIYEIERVSQEPIDVDELREADDAA